MGAFRVIARGLVPVALVAACGGGNRKPYVPPKTDTKPVAAPAQTEADRAKLRHELAITLVPSGSNCLPPSLKDDSAPRLELAALGADAILCANDIDRSRLLGPIACWKVDLATGGLTYQDPTPLPGRGFDVLLDGHCARGYCIPEEAKLPADAKVAHIAWSLDGAKVAILLGDDVHLFDAATKAHQSTFSIKGEKGVTNDAFAVHMIGDTVIVEGADQGPYSAVWLYKSDGTALGPISTLGGKEEKPISTYKGSLSLLDKNRVAASEKGFETLTVYELDTGKRSKLVRKLPRYACKPDELDAFWHDGDKVSEKCKGSVEAGASHLIGATAVAGSKNFLVLLRDDRLGELGVLDAKSLAEKKAIKMPWCDAAADKKAEAPNDKDEKGEKGEKGEKDQKEKAKPADKAKGASDKKTSEPEEGGQ